MVLKKFIDQRMAVFSRTVRILHEDDTDFVRKLGFSTALTHVV